MLTMLLLTVLIGLAMAVVTNLVHPDQHQEGFTTFSEIYNRKSSQLHRKLIPRVENTRMAVETRGQEGDLAAAPIVARGERFAAVDYFTGNSYTIRPLKRGLKFEVDLDTVTEGPTHLASIMGKIAGKMERSINKAEESACATFYAGLFTTTLSPDGAAVSASPGINTGHLLGDGTYDANRGIDDGSGAGTFMDVNFTPLNFEKLYDQYGQQKGHEGDPLMPDPNVKLVCSYDLRSRVLRFAKNENLAETANRDINPNFDHITAVIASQWLVYAGLTKFWGVLASDAEQQPFLRLDRRGRRPKTWIEEDGTIRVYVNSAIWQNTSEDYRGCHFTQGT